MKTLALFLLVVVSAPVFAQADASEREVLRGRYFMMVWCYQGKGNAPKDAHTFAAFYNGDDLSDGKVTPTTISWLPATGIVRPLAVERGRNFSLAQTLTMACQTGKRVASWGPYEITFDLYRRALDWPAPGAKDIELGVLMEQEVGHGEAEAHTRVQA